MKTHRDWRVVQDYAYCATLNAGQWAWEFLRRNPGYQRDWAWFSSAWAQLEARYGKPPERDYQAWVNDPLSYRRVDDDSGDCRVDEDKVLIECWMGARWGFYKFPLDPATECPEIGVQLDWRPIDNALPWLDESDTAYLGERVERVALGFELDLPLREQLERAREQLARRQARLRKQGKVTMRTVAALSPRWTLMVRLLDARREAVSPQTLSAALGEAPDAMCYQDLLREAEALVDAGYRHIARLREGRAL